MNRILRKAKWIARRNIRNLLSIRFSFWLMLAVFYLSHWAIGDGGDAITHMLLAGIIGELLDANIKLQILLDQNSRRAQRRAYNKPVNIGRTQDETHYHTHPD